MKKTIITLLAAGGLVLGANAQALTVSSSFSNAQETTEINQTGSLDFFDSSLGTLNSVTLELTGTSLSSSLLTNNAAGTENFSFESSLNFFFDISAVSGTVPVPAFITTLASTGGFTSLASGASQALGPNADSGSVFATLTAADYASFVGAGQFNVGCNTITGTVFTGGGGNIANDQNTVAGCGAEVTYDFTAPPTQVPAPTALLLIGAGLLGFAGVRRAKKSS